MTCPISLTVVSLHVRISVWFLTIFTIAKVFVVDRRDSQYAVRDSCGSV